MSDWYYYCQDQQKGPISELALKELISNQSLPLDTFVWKEGLEGWIPAQEREEFVPAPAPITVSALLPVAGANNSSAGVTKPCVVCKAAEALPGYPTLLCEPCRTTMIHRPIPLVLKLAAGVLVGLMLISALRIPWELSATLNYERGRLAEDKKDYRAAILSYQKALVIYPKSVDVLTAMARAEHRAGDQDLALHYVKAITSQISPTDPVPNETIGVIKEVTGTP